MATTTSNPSTSRRLPTILTILGSSSTSKMRGLSAIAPDLLSKRSMNLRQELLRLKRLLDPVRRPDLDTPIGQPMDMALRTCKDNHGDAGGGGLPLQRLTHLIAV